MTSDPVNIEVLWSLTTEQKLLTDVEQFLENADEPGLTKKLEKLGQDAGVALGDVLANPAPDEVASPTLENLKNHHAEGGAIMPGDLDFIARYEPVTRERLELFVAVERALEAHGAEQYQAFAYFSSAVRAMAAPTPLPGAAADFTPAPQPGL